jgi:hypothetical protein
LGDLCRVDLPGGAYFVGAEQGAASILSGMSIHEFVDDGRHPLGFPCH